MITFPALGNFGRLGNQLFQMAAAIGLALDHNDTYGFPLWRYSDRFRIGGCFHERLPDVPVYREPAFEYNEIPYQDNLGIYGYFQSWRYFERHADVIRALLSPIDIPSCEAHESTASVHVRRGDYVGSPYHPLPPISYYERAVEILRPQGVQKFLVFSDDIDWCRENLSGLPFDFVPQADEVTHLSRMISCDHHVIANSSYSWWAAWLNSAKNKKVVAPTRWFGEGGRNTKDLIPNGWMLI